MGQPSGISCSPYHIYGVWLIPSPFTFFANFSWWCARSTFRRRAPDRRAPLRPERVRGANHVQCRRPGPGYGRCNSRFHRKLTLCRSKECLSAFFRGISGKNTVSRVSFSILWLFFLFSLHSFLIAFWNHPVFFPFFLIYWPAQSLMPVYDSALCFHNPRMSLCHYFEKVPLSWKII